MLHVDETIQESLQKRIQTILNPHLASVRFSVITQESASFLVNKTNWRTREKEETQRLKEEIYLIPPIQGQENIPIPLYLSASHTQSDDHLAVLVVGSTIPIGVDLEKKDRALSQKLAKRIALDSERKFSLSPLEFWIAKEAAFKACPTNRGTFLSQYIVVEWNPQERRGKIQYPALSAQLQTASASANRVCSFVLFELDLWRIALAF